ncbi:MAG: hypothetical protein JJ992_08655, partial [Planctomycetes bacterium]|nr:hypothetical protein [Planctomycetota bacterium]
MNKANEAAYYAGDDGRAEVEMTISDKSGTTRTRKFTILRMDTEGGTQKFYVYFKEPADLYKQVFLVWKEVAEGKHDSRWMWLPALNLKREIAPGDSWTCLQVESSTRETRPDLPPPSGEGNDWIPASIGFMGFVAFIEPVDEPAIQIVKYTNDADANDPDGPGVPVIEPDATVTWTYEVTNIGTVDIPEADITVTDNVEGEITQIVDKGDGDAILAPSEVWLYQATGTAVNLASPPADPGLVLVPDVCTQGNVANEPSTAYTNVGTVTIPSMSDEDPSSYCNPPEEPEEPAIQIVKYTNNEDANDPDGVDVPIIRPGDPVMWTYEVTN